MATINELLQKHGDAMVRSHLRKIVEIYDLDWIVAHELIQNAIDAIQVNPRIVDDGLVTVTFDLDHDTVLVRDNGIGFAHNLELLCPGGTGDEKRLSSRSPAKGYQGVGLKAVMYSTERFELESQTTDSHWMFLSEHLADFIEPGSDTTPDYTEEVTEQEAETTWTQVAATFRTGAVAEFVSSIERFIAPEGNWWWQSLYRQEEHDSGGPPVGSYLQHVLRWYFRSHSYIGDYNRLLNVAVTNADTGEFEDIKAIDVSLEFRSPTNGFSHVTGRLGDWLHALGEDTFRVIVQNRAWDYSELAEENLARAQKYRQAPEVVYRKPNDPNWEELSVSFQDKLLDVKLRPNQRAGEFRDKYAEAIALLERRGSSVKAEDFQDVLEAITGIYLVIGRTTHLELLGVTNRGQRIIASNGTPTAHELSARSTSSTWYLETIHMVINVDATLNLGKRHLVNTRLVGRLNEFFEACYPTLVKISKLFVGRDSDTVKPEPPPEVLGLRSIRREGLPFRRFPADENVLLAMFCAVLGELMPEVGLYGLFSKATYDGTFVWSGDDPPSESDLAKLEFKLRLDDLLGEFEHAIHEKEFTAVDAIIVWDRRSTLPGWTVKGISPTRRTALEDTGVSTENLEYVLENRYGNYRPLICVPDLLLKVPESEGGDDVQEFVEEMG